MYGQLPPIEAHDVLVKSGGMSQILLWTSFLEIFGGIALFQTIQGKRYPGDFQFDPLGLSQVSFCCMLFMFKFSFLRHDTTTTGYGSARGVNLRHSYLMFMANVQGKNAASFEKYQLAEVKHSRLAMLAFSG